MSLDSKMRIAINGVGRIGRNILRLAIESNLDIIAINDLYDISDLAYLLKHDSIHGLFNKRIEVKGDSLIIESKTIKYFSESDFSKLPWKDLAIDLVIDSSGQSTNKYVAKKHILAGAKRVGVTSTMDDPDITFISGVSNLSLLSSDHQIISLGSCSSVCLAPIIYLLEKNLGIDNFTIIDIHPFTNDQKLLDSFSEKRRRGRSAFNNIIPTTTSGVLSLRNVFPKLKDKIHGYSIRVPVECGALINVILKLSKTTNVKDLNDLLEKSSLGELKGIMRFAREEIVSRDIIGDNHSCIIDGLSTRVLGDNIGLLVWYDNEVSYASRIIDFLISYKRLLAPQRK